MYVPYLCQKYVYQKHPPKKHKLSTTKIFCQSLRLSRKIKKKHFWEKAQKGRKTLIFGTILNMPKHFQIKLLEVGPVP